MLTLRLTQKLAARLHVSLLSNVVPAANPAADWCCHRFTADRCGYLLITNAPTFLSVVLRAQGLGDESAFISGVLAGLREYLRSAGHEFAFAQLIAPETSEVVFRPVGDRRILGVMNDFIFMAKLYLTDLSPSETSDRLNECPVSPLRGKFPRDVFPPRPTADLKALD
jgi:Domain of unknown function (DUF6933)